MNETSQKVTVDPATGCWVWQGATDGYGNPRLHRKGRPLTAKFEYWRKAHPDAPRPTRLYPLCGNRLCVNPDHMTPAKERVDARNRLMLRISTIKYWLSTELDEAARLELEQTLKLLEEELKCQQNQGAE